MDLLRDPVWQGIAALIAILGVLYAALTFLFPTLKRRLRQWLVEAAETMISFFKKLIAWASHLKKLLKAGLDWVAENWALVIGLLALAAVAGGVYLLTQTWWSIALTLWLALALALLTRWLYSPARPRFEVMSLPVGQVANANLERFYADPPLGENHLGGVKFQLLSGPSVFDTSAARFIEADGTIKCELGIPEAVGSVKSVHLLINAGGGFRFDETSKTPLEWMKIGKIELQFDDGSSQATELILGGNVREWAIGNSPGKLVDRVDDPKARLAWRGRNTSGKQAVIDQLEIPISKVNRGKKLERIVFVREISKKALPSEGGDLHFLVSAVTLELSEPRRTTARGFWLGMFAAPLAISVIALMIGLWPKATSVPTATIVCCSSPTPTVKTLASDTPTSEPTKDQGSVTVAPSATTDPGPTGTQEPPATAEVTPGPTATMGALAIVTSRRGTETEVLVDSLELGRGLGGWKGLPLVSGETVLFSRMKSFAVVEVTEIDETRRVTVAMTLGNNEVITEELRSGNYLSASTPDGTFYLDIEEVESVDFPPIFDTPSPTAEVRPAQTSTATAVSVSAVGLGGEYSVIRLTTGLNITRTLDFRDMEVEDDVISRLVANRRHSLGAEQIAVQVYDTLYLIMPLSRLRRAYESYDGQRVVELANGDEIEGELAFKLSDANGVQYELGTAKRVELISLSESDHLAEQTEERGEGLWQLDISEPGTLRYSVSDPRFMFQYSYLTSTGSYNYPEATSRQFYLKDASGKEHLAFLADFEKIAFGTNQAITLKTGDVETTGTVVLKSSEGHRGHIWYIVADLVGGETVIAIKNPVAILHQKTQ